MNDITRDPLIAPAVNDIADLLAWARKLTEIPTTTDQGERAAFLAAKANLLARITDHAPPPKTPPETLHEAPRETS